MDHKELANLIFPNAKDVSYYEEKYPERNLKEEAMWLRLAPSPTGFVHIGGIYTSVICSKLAKLVSHFLVCQLSPFCHI